MASIEFELPYDSVAAYQFHCCYVLVLITDLFPNLCYMLMRAVRKKTLEL